MKAARRYPPYPFSHPTTLEQKKKNRGSSFRSLHQFAQNKPTDQRAAGCLAAWSTTAPTLRSHLHDLQDLPRSANECFTGRRPESSQPRRRWCAQQPSARSVVRNAGPKAAFVPCALCAVESNADMPVPLALRIDPASAPAAPASACHNAGAAGTRAGQQCGVLRPKLHSFHV